MDWQQNIPHRRFNLLNGSWVLCSPHRAKRPWLGQVENIVRDSLPPYEPTCYLCPGNKRASASSEKEPEINPLYKSTFVFQNDFSALLSESETESLFVSHESPTNNETEEGSDNRRRRRLLLSSPAYGNCRVICFSPRHDLTLAAMELKDISDVILCWKEQYEQLATMNHSICYIQIFENRGAMMGCSNPHPHCQIWSSTFIPQEASVELRSMEDYWRKHGHCLLCEYLELEKHLQTRVVVENDGFLAIVPYWALWPFELLVISKRHIGNLSQFQQQGQAQSDHLGNELQQLADIIKKITLKYDKLFQISFPYSMGLHQTPVNTLEAKYEYFHFHIHYYPPLLRSATIKKFMVGYEMFAEPQRDLTAERCAERLRTLDHW